MRGRVQTMPLSAGKTQDLILGEEENSVFPVQGAISILAVLAYSRSSFGRGTETLCVDQPNSHAESLFVQSCHTIK